MKKENIKKEAERHISDLFKQAEKNSKYASRYIKIAKKTASRFNLKITKYKRKFCKKCLSLYDSKNSERRIKKGKLIIKCLKCGNIQRYGLR